MDLGKQRFSVYSPWIWENRDLPFTVHGFRKTEISHLQTIDLGPLGSVFTNHGIRKTGIFCLHTMDLEIQEFLMGLGTQGLVMCMRWIQQHVDFSFIFYGFRSLGSSLIDHGFRIKEIFSFKHHGFRNIRIGQLHI